MRSELESVSRVPGAMQRAAMRRRTRTHTCVLQPWPPGSAAHRFTLRCVRGTLPPGLFPPCREIGQCLLVGRGIEPEDRAALADFLGDKILERGHLEGLVGDLVGEMRGDHDHAVAVAENDIAGKYRRVAAADRTVDLDRLMQREIGRR